MLQKNVMLSLNDAIAPGPHLGPSHKVSVSLCTPGDQGGRYVTGELWEVTPAKIYENFRGSGVECGGSVMKRGASSWLELIFYQRALSWLELPFCQCTPFWLLFS